MKYKPLPQYNFVRSLKDHLGGDLDTARNFDLHIPRQLEIHLPGTGEVPCNFSCPVCAGQNCTLGVSKWEKHALRLLKKLGGIVPYNILGGAYTEPMINPYFYDYIHLTKDLKNHFGVHTNGSVLIHQIDELTKVMKRKDTGPTDYFSISLYGGNQKSFLRSTRTKPEDGYFEDIENGVIALGNIREEAKSKIALRLSYLGNSINLGEDEIKYVVDLAKRAKLDSVRMCIAFAPYQVQFFRVRKYRNWERKKEAEIMSWLKPFLSKQEGEKPYVFYRPVDLQDISLYEPIKHCYYGYFQVTFGADGIVYRCSTTTTFPTHAVGRIIDLHNEQDFMGVIANNQDPDFDPKQQCFERGLRCNQMGLQVNLALSEGRRLVE